MTGAVAISLSSLSRLFDEHVSAKPGPYPDTIARFVQVPQKFWSKLRAQREVAWARGTSAYFF